MSKVNKQIFLVVKATIPMSYLDVLVVLRDGMIRAVMGFHLYKKLHSVVNNNCVNFTQQV